jgi:PAS domain S-box-containing protein
MDDGLAGWVFRHRQAALIEDTQADNRWLNFHPDNTAPRSAICVPMSRRDRVAGLLTLVHPDLAHFQALDLELALAIGGLAAVAIENARLFTRVSAERQTLSAVLNNVRAAILVTDLDRRILLINPPACAIFGIQPEEATGIPLSDAIDNPELLQLFENGSTDVTTPVSGEISTPDQSTYSATLSPVPQVGYAIVLHDITFLQRLDELRTESLAAVSHDLRAPLSIILGSAEVMATNPDLGQEQQGFVDLITSTVERMHRLVEGLLDLSQLEAGQPLNTETTSLPVILDQLLPESTAQATIKDVHLNIQVAPDLPSFQGDPLRLGRAIANLLHNAIKYTPAGGKVNLNATGLPDEKAILISIVDTGPGIPAAAQGRLFEKFYRVGSLQTVEWEGAGLGLAIVRSIVRAHRGRVWVESQEGHGSTFTIWLPLIEKESI